MRILVDLEMLLNYWWNLNTILTLKYTFDSMMLATALPLPTNFRRCQMQAGAALQ